MKKSYNYYENRGLSQTDINECLRIIRDIRNGRYDERDIRSLNTPERLNLCLTEDAGVFETIVSPFEYEEFGQKKYKYLTDPFSAGIPDYIKYLPTSKEAVLQRINENLAYEARAFNRPFVPRTLSSLSEEELTYMPEDEKIEILQVIFNYKKEQLYTMQVKDCFPRAISGLANPISSEIDVIYLTEWPLLLASLELYRKGIRTVHNDVEGSYGDIPVTNGFANIGIDCTNLTPGNIAYVNSLLNSGLAIKSPSTDKWVTLRVPCSSTSQVADVSERMLALTNGFGNQRFRIVNQGTVRK